MVKNVIQSYNIGMNNNSLDYSVIMGERKINYVHKPFISLNRTLLFQSWILSGRPYLGVDSLYWFRSGPRYCRQYSKDMHLRLA